MKIDQKQVEWIGRIALAVIFGWFGFLKIIGLSPANGLIESLLGITLPFIPFAGFIVFLGVWETLVGVLFLFPKLTKWAFWLMLVQMFTTFGPLLFLPLISWQSFAVPTLEGQYIIKNLALVALGLNIYWCARKRD